MQAHYGFKWYEWVGWCLCFGKGIPTQHISTPTPLNIAVFPTTRNEPKLKSSNHRSTTPLIFLNWGVAYLHQESLGTNILRKTLATDISSTNHIVITPKYSLSAKCTFNLPLFGALMTMWLEHGIKDMKI
jgi:hypothetical protein